MTEKPPVWADLLLTFWVLVVGVVYFGGFFVPEIGAWTGRAAAVYALMLLVSVCVLAWNFLNRADTHK